ncbi:MAG: SDR family oxidoreductase [Alphaproteobacteria bacterium]|nr:SDR family oxidoreductase [Alphaproteobacteria bacterium]
MHVVIFGGTGPTGRLAVEQALAAGHHVRVLARTPSKLAMEHERLEVVAGDALSAEDIARAIAGQDAVVTTLGVPYTFSEVTLYSTATEHILAGMRAAGVRRLVGVTSGGTLPGRDPNTPWFFQYLLKPIIGRTLYADMRRMEALIMASDTDWTILRPSRLMDRPSSGAVRVVPDAYTLPGGDEVSRVDLAATIVAELGEGAHVGKGVAVAD